MLLIKCEQYASITHNVTFRMYKKTFTKYTDTGLQNIQAVWTT